MDKKNCIKKEFDWTDFLKQGYFLGSPAFHKVWCIYHPSESYQEIPNSQINQTHEFYESQRKFYFYRNNFDGSLEKPWISGEHCVEFEIDDFFAKIKEFHSDAPKVNWHIDENLKSQNTYRNIFEKIKLALETSTFQKAVPFYREQGTLELSQKNLVHFFKCLIPLKQNSELFFYGIWDFQNGNNKMHFGASPELLFVKNDNKVETIALAGTSTTPTTEFAEIKMHAEHEYVVQDLSENLKKYGNVLIHPKMITPFQTFFHQKTKISISCAHTKIQFEDLLKSIYPSAAIGAYPRAKGLEFLRKLEEDHDQKRGFFAAPFGVQFASQGANDFMLCLSAIRGIECDAGKIFITAGGGVVEQSVFDNEWKEIGLKIQSIKSIYQLV